MGEVEVRIKELIIKKYGSLKRFCELIDMPWTTLDSILKRGFSNSNITNVMKITKELNIDTEKLASGIITSSHNFNDEIDYAVIIPDSDMIIIQRERNKMSDKQKTRLMNILKANFDEFNWEEDDSGNID